MSIGSDLRTFLLTGSAITSIVGSNVYHGRVPQRDGNIPYVWINRRGIHDVRQNTGTRGQAPLGYYYDVDAVSEDIAEAEDLADAIRAHCQYYAGTMGSRSVNQLYVSDQSEDYVSVNADADAGVFVQSLLLEIIP